MERCDGDLSEYIARNGGRLSESVTRDVMRQVVGAVSYLHSRGMTHRDIKPANILTKGSLFKVADFGLSKFGFDFSSIVGTPRYSAPEINMSNKWNPYDYKVDVWALGVVMLECFLGSQAVIANFNQELNVAALFRIMNSASIEMRDLASKMLERNPDMRYSAQDVMNHRFIRN